MGPTPYQCNLARMLFIDVLPIRYSSLRFIGTGCQICPMLIHDTPLA